MRSMQISILNEQKTLFQFALHGKQIACFIRLFAGANYDLNCNSVCSPRFFSFTPLEKVVNYNRKVICKKLFC